MLDFIVVLTLLILAASHTGLAMRVTRLENAVDVLMQRELSRRTAEIAGAQQASEQVRRAQNR